MTKPLSEIPFDKLSVGDPLISALNNHGKIIEIIPEGSKCSKGYSWGKPTIIIKWDAGKFSFVPHDYCDSIIYNKEEPVTEITKDDVDNILLNILKKFEENFDDVRHRKVVNVDHGRTEYNWYLSIGYGFDTVEVMEHNRSVYCGSYGTGNRDVYELFDTLYRKSVIRDEENKKKIEEQARKARESVEYKELVRNHRELSNILKSLS